MPQLDVYMFYTSTFQTFIFFMIFVVIFKLLLLPMIFANLTMRKWYTKNLLKKRMMITLNIMTVRNFKDSMLKNYISTLLLI
jgi:hypothetical protein